MRQPPEPSPASSSFDIERARSDFPALRQQVHGKPLAYLDNGATTLKPQVVIDTLAEMYARDVGNVHRGVHELSARATQRYEASRESVRRFLGAADASEIVFVRGTTEAINLVAHSFGDGLRRGDEIVVTELEHHSNIVPWQLLCERSGARLRVVPITDAGEVSPTAFSARLSDRTRLVSFAHVSNALGTVLPVAELCRRAHAAGAKVLVDGAQAAAHLPVDVRELGCDFYAFSGHKIYGPTGIGALYGRAELLAQMPPYQGGGEMIEEVSFERTTYADPPARFEAGTPHIAGAVGLGAALEYLSALDRRALAAHEEALLAYAVDRLESLGGLRLVGMAKERAAVISFVVDGVHPHDVGTILDREGVAVRAGHHCAQPAMERYGLSGTTRASFALYNTFDDVDRLVSALKNVRELFR